MFVKWWFEFKRKEFFRKRVKFLAAAHGCEVAGDTVAASEIKAAVKELEEEAEKISLHYATGGSCLSKGIFWRVYAFWGNLSNLDESLKSIWQQILEFIVFVGGTVFLVKRFWFGFYAVPSGSAEPNLLIGDRICGVKYPYLFKNPSRGDLIIFDEVTFKYSKNPLVKLYQKYIGFPLGPLPAGPEAWTKRVVGIAGDRVKMNINENGRGEIFVNGGRLPEPNRNPYPLILLKRRSGFLSAKNPLFKLPIAGGILSSLLKEKEDVARYTFDPTRPYDQQPFYNFDKKEVILDPQTGKPYIYLPEKADLKQDSQPEFVVPKGYVYLVGDNRWNSSDGRVWGTIPLSLVQGRVSFIVFSVDGTESWWFMEFLKNPITFLTKKIRWRRTFRSLHPFKAIPTS